jgi:hypothetical protein
MTPADRAALPLVPFMVPFVVVQVRFSASSER